ncbi:MAG: ABC transporter permease/substrate-binding protein [Longicatena sp.]
MLFDIFKFYQDRADFIIPLILEHLQISIIAILFATLIGISLGIFISEKKKTSSFILGVVSFIYTIPSISLLGILIPITGIGNTSAILALSVYALLPIIRCTYTGLNSIDSSILEAAKSMGSTRFQILYKIKLPLAFPIILSGFRNMVVMTISLAGIASFIGAGGLGVAIYRGITTNNMTMTVAGSIAVALLALIADLSIGVFERRYTRHHKKRITNKKYIIIFLCLLLGGGITLCTQTKKRDTIHIATKPMTEGLILGEVLKQLIENDTNLHVELTKGVGGGTSNIHPAILNGEFDMYSEYTGTAWEFILKKKPMMNQDDAFQTLLKEYEKQFQLTWKGLYGFNNTYGIAITKEFADTYQIKTYSDLASHSKDITFGAEYDFYERDDGFNALATKYNFEFKNKIDLEIGLKYKALDEDKVNAIIVYHTDGDLSNERYVLLEDDLNFFNKYYAGTVIRLETLKKHPELLPVLEKLQGAINDIEMAKMNADVNIENKNEEDVARKFLLDKNLLEENNE